MLCHLEPPPDSNVVAIFVDLENVLDCREANQEDFFHDLTNFLAAISIQLHRARLSLHPRYSRLYLERRCWHAEAWQQRGSTIAEQLGFVIKWTARNRSAESFIETDIQRILASKETLPRTVIVFSGDGDLIPVIGDLSWRRHEVCVVSKPARLNHWLPLVASGVIDLQDLTGIPA